MLRSEDTSCSVRLLEHSILRRLSGKPQSRQCPGHLPLPFTLPLRVLFLTVTVVHTSSLQVLEPSHFDTWDADVSMRMLDGSHEGALLYSLSHVPN